MNHNISGKAEPKQSYCLADDNNCNKVVLGTASSPWWYDCRGAEIKAEKLDSFPISNNGSPYETGMIRELRETSEGVVTAVITMDADTTDGLFIKSYDRDKNDVLYLFGNEGKIHIKNDDDTDTIICDALNCGFIRFEFVIDFDNQNITNIVGDASKTFAMSAAKSISFLKIGTLPFSKINLNIRNIYINANYAVNDNFKLYNDGEMPCAWLSDDVGSCRVERSNMLIDNTSVVRSFDEITGRVCVEAFMYTSNKDDICGIKIHSGTCEVFELHNNLGTWSALGQMLENAQNEMWYRIRLEIDTDEASVNVKINGKSLGTCKLNEKCEYIDGISFYGKYCTLYVDRVKVYNLIDYDDYCPKPIVPEKKNGHTVGINVCSLWHSRYHIGWDCISPYDEIKPALGFYDEGIPEVADWEIKFLAENGVDFQMFCWYASASDGPMKDTAHSFDLHDGYMNAKYSNMCKFAILWEAANGVHPKDAQAFRKYFVPYFIEHFFSDSRYMTIDNKAIMAVFGTTALIGDLGSPEAVKCELEYLRSEVRKLGYDDLIILNCGFSGEEIEKCGFDGSYQYGWGKQGCDPDFTISAIKAQKQNDTLNAVPTVSTGFNNVGWACTRSKNITVDDFKKVHLAVRDEIMPTLSDQPEWSQKLVMLSNWNEYGEGTYIMPCEKHVGFGYLEAVKDVYTNSRINTNIYPSDKQKSRLGYMYPQNRKAIQCLGYYTKPEPDNVVKSYNFGIGNVDDLYSLKDTTAKLDENGSLIGKTFGGDPSLVLKGKCHIDMSGITHIRVRGKTSLPTHVEFFYLTEGQTEFTQRQAMNVQLKPENDYGVSPIVDRIPQNTVITGLRVDPASITVVDYELYGVDLISAPELIYKITAGGFTENMFIPFVVEDDCIYLPLNPKQSYLYRLGICYEYYADDKKLCLFGTDSSIVFTDESDNATVNNCNVKLKRKFGSFDGLPMLPLDLLCEVFNLKYSLSESHLKIERI